MCALAWVKGVPKADQALQHSPGDIIALPIPARQRRPKVLVLLSALHLFPDARGHRLPGPIRAVGMAAILFFRRLRGLISARLSQPQHTELLLQQSTCVVKARVVQADVRILEHLVDEFWRTTICICTFLRPAVE